MVASGINLKLRSRLGMSTVANALIAKHLIPTATQTCIKSFLPGFDNQIWPSLSSINTNPNQL